MQMKLWKHLLQTRVIKGYKGAVDKVPRHLGGGVGGEKVYFQISWFYHLQSSSIVIVKTYSEEYGAHYIYTYIHACI